MREYDRLSTFVNNFSTVDWSSAYKRHGQSYSRLPCALPGNSCSNGIDEIDGLERAIPLINSVNGSVSSADGAISDALFFEAPNFCESCVMKDWHFNDTTSTTGTVASVRAVDCINNDSFLANDDC